MHFSRYLDYWARHRGDQPAFRCEGVDLTWAEFDARARALAWSYQSLGVRRGDRVGCLLENRIEWCVAFAAAIHAGAALTPLNPAFGYVELRAILADADPAVLVTTPRLAQGLGWDDASGMSVVSDAPLVYDARTGQARFSVAEATCADQRSAPAGGEASDLIGISYTSGTTGTPKGVMLTHEAVDIACSGLALGLGWTSQEHLLVVAPLSFTGGFICNLAPVMRQGCRATVHPTFDAAAALHAMTNEGVTYLGGVPALWQRIVTTPGFAQAHLGAMRNGLAGGAPVLPELLKTYAAKGVVLRQQYGCTEGCGGATLPDVESALARPEACGFPVAGLDLQLLDARGEPTPPGEVGEICLRGPGLMSGYWRNPELTAAAFAGEWYRTGDLGIMHLHGLQVVDRKKNMVISGGVNIYPAEVERALGDIAGVMEIAAIGVPSDDWGQELVAIVRLSLEDELSLESLQMQARERLGRMKTPKRYALTREPLPRTVTNKIARQDLQQLFESLEAGA